MRIWTFVFCLFSGTLLAQISAVPRDKAAYLTEIESILRKDKQATTDQRELLLADFSKVWNSDSVNAREAAALYNLSDAMLQKRISDFETWRYALEIFRYFQIAYQDSTPLALLRHFSTFIKEEPSRRGRDYLNTHYQVLFQSSLFYDGRLRWGFDGDFEYQFAEEPTYTFSSLNLWGKFKNDSTLIENTSGVYYPLRYRFKGSEGRSFFTRAGLTADSAYVALTQYEIDVQQSDFRADSVMLHSKIYPREPTQGYFEEKLTSQAKNKTNSFPRFFSYRNDIVIDNLLPGAFFSGSFAMIGSRFYGGGTDTSKAFVTFSYQDTILLRGRSNRFLLQTDMLYSDNVQFSLYLKGDSIYHPKVTLRYLPASKQFTIIRKDEGMGQGPFTDTYHNLDMKFDLINWNLGAPQMTISNLNLGSEAPVIFESNNYYRSRRYDQLQGVANTNPLLRLKNIRQLYGRKEVSTAEVARAMKMDERSAHIFMMQMAVFGFVEYDVLQRQAVLKDKIIEYILNRKGKRDFDVIQFVSRMSQGDNAKLSLEDFSMDINGIDRITVSDSQKVGLFPAGGQITMKKDLDFEFDGQISAGLFNFWGRDLEFSYAQFRINMTDVDSMRFKVKSFKANDLGYRELKKVRTVLQDINGELLIDKPNNKSGKEYHSEYPIFKSATNSYIYYDKANIFDSVYNREQFFVELEPFTIDSLDNINTEGLFFNGTFNSANIFPQMPQVITVQRDYSLGFDMLTPPGGLAAYGGKGTFTDSLFLSNKGLRGKGKLDYMLAHAESDEFFFFPDSTNGLASTYEIQDQAGTANHPHVQADSAYLHWEPYRDLLYATNKGQPFTMYDDIGMKTDGTLAYGTAGLQGEGKLDFLNAQMQAAEFQFKKRQFSSDSTSFQVRASPLADVGFAVDNATALVDFDQKKGEFTLNGSAEFFEFPKNQYVATMDYALWQMDAKAINVSRKKTNQLAKMISVHPQQDSLRFEADRARFYLENSLLEGFQVPEIRVADASVYPDTGYVAIDPKAKMRTLHNAAVTATRATQYHQFLGSSIDIQSRQRYSGTGDYEYIDKDGTPWPIRFHTIKADTSGTTIGSADIALDEYFYMSPHFAYYGKASLQADREELLFRGKTKIETSCPGVSTDWFAFESLIDPFDIRIDLPEIDPDDKTKILANGIYLSADTLSGYAAFLSRDVSPNDQQMFFANGQLYYDELEGSFIITSAERQADSSAAANILKFKDADCSLTGIGEMSLGGNQDPISMRAFGEITYDLNTDDMQLDIVLALDFLFSEAAQERMRQSISLESDGDGSDLTRPVFTTALQFLLDEKDRNALLADVRDYGAPEKLPKELRHTMFLSDLNLVWTPESRSFLSTGPIGIGALGKEFVNRKSDGRFELQRRRRGDELYMHWDISPNLEYFWEYKRGMMRLYSSDDGVMDIIKELDIKDRRDTKTGTIPFNYTIATESRLRLFLRRLALIEE